MHSPQLIVLKKLVATVGALCLGIASASSQEMPSLTWTLGWDGLVTVGRWTPVTVEFTLERPTECRLELSALDAEGHTATYVTTASLPAGEQRLTGIFQCGRIDSTVRARLFLGSDVAHGDEVFRPGRGEFRALTKLADRMIVTAGRPKGFDRLARPAASAVDAAIHVVERDSPADLPSDLRSYDSAHWLVLAGTGLVPEDVSEALREWVADGGRLLLSLPKQLETYQQSPLKGWLPVEVGEQPIVVLDLGRLEDLAGRSIRIPTTGRQPVAKLSATEGVALALSRDDPLLLRAPYGFGEVYVLGMDLTQAPLAGWGGLHDFVQNVLEIPPPVTAKTQQRARQLTSSGISELASQIQACQDHFSVVERPSPWWTMAWMLGLVALIGPLDYLLVHRVLQRPHATWITLPVFLLIAGTLAARSAGSWNTSRAQVNQLHLVDLDASSHRMRVQGWTTLYSPVTTRTDVALQPSDFDIALVDWPVHRALSSSAVPETVFGGIYRPGGTEWGRTEYRVFADKQSIERLPILQWSSRTLTDEWSRDGVPLASSDLKSTGLGRLTGAITHQLPGKITDWILAHGNRAYRRQPSREEETSVPWPSGQTLLVDDPLVFQRDLRGVLTRAVTHREHREGVQGLTIRETQSRYDPLDRDPLAVCQMLTFHQAAGGSDYSGLSNHMLANHDLTPQLQLGRAVLFGRLTPPSGTTISRDGQPAHPDRHDVFVRIVLPVESSGEIVRDLPKFKTGE